MILKVHLITMIGPAADYLPGSISQGVQTNVPLARHTLLAIPLLRALTAAPATRM